MRTRLHHLVLRMRGILMRTCALCGGASSGPVTSYGTYGFCSRDHKAEWHRHMVM